MAEPQPVPDDVVEDLRLCLYRSFADTGRLPGLDRLVEIAGSAEGVADGLAALAAARHLALDEDGEVALAHPFASRTFGFSVMSTDTLWWGGCAWDSFALPHLVTRVPDVLVATRCPMCDAPMAWVVDREAPPAGDEVAHFLVPAERIWDDVIHTCSNQRLFCGHGCIDEWLAVNDEPEGYRLDLETLWRLAAHWYDGRLERGYQRRDPTSAHDYLRSVGLSGPFWGL